MKKKKPTREELKKELKKELQDYNKRCICLGPFCGRFYGDRCRGCYENLGYDS